VPLLRTRCPADFRHFCNDLACDAENRFSRKLPAESEQGRMGIGAGVSAIDSNGRTIWIADAHRGDGKRFVVRGDEKLTAFLELEIATGGQRDGFLGKGVFLTWGRRCDLGEIFLNNQGSTHVDKPSRTIYKPPRFRNPTVSPYLRHG